jgi:hypothetical protein
VVLVNTLQIANYSRSPVSSQIGAFSIFTLPGDHARRSTIARCHFTQ